MDFSIELLKYVFFFIFKAAVRSLTVTLLHK